MEGFLELSRKALERPYVSPHLASSVQAFYVRVVAVSLYYCPGIFLVLILRPTPGSVFPDSELHAELFKTDLVSIVVKRCSFFLATSNPCLQKI